ncbi:nucleotide exchange factor GrpE [Actinophytocola sp.]|uniref:nucleotide exchange factor GrpE n=1 Tax=Actinophytocola sp. TaxID=1872138 RepID=UPI002ED33BAD
MGRSNRQRRVRKQTAAQSPAVPPDGDLLGTLAKTRTETVSLLRGMDAHRAHMEATLREINRHELDIGRLLNGIADVLDTFDRLLAYDGDDVEAYRASVRKTSDLLVDVLCNNSGMELIGRSGEIADPATHQVVVLQDGSDLPQDTVIRVIERGIRYRGDLIRPASVIVSSGKEQNA